MGSPELKFFSLNVRGLNVPFKRHCLFRDLHKYKPAVVCLQETHFRSHDAPRLRSQMYPEAYHSMSPTKSRGVSILFHRDWLFQVASQHQDKEGRMLILIGSLNDVPVTIVNLYFPNVNQLQFLRKAHKQIQSLSQGAVYICGDFNMTPCPMVDCQSSGSRLPSQKAKSLGRRFTDFLHSVDLYDVWRISHPQTRDYTFYSQVHSSYSRIDLCLIHRTMVHHLLDAHIGPMTWSDHAPLILSFRAHFPARGMGSWRLNDSLIVDPAGRDGAASVLEDYFRLNTSEEVAISSVWSAHKAVIRGHFIKQGAYRKKQYTLKTSTLLQQISSLESQNKNKPTPSIASQLLSLRKELEHLNLQAMERSLRKLNYTSYTQGNKAGKLLASKLRARRVQTKITHIEGLGGQIVRNPALIVSEFANYYSSLYNLKLDSAISPPCSAEISTFLAEAQLPTLLPHQQADLLTPFSEEDVYKAIRALPKGKAPGPDGLSNLYYQNFASLLVPTLTALFNHIKTTGQVPPEMLLATVVTLPKPGKPPTHCANFRPISLLNVDIKLYAKLLASRVAPLLPKLIHPDQTGFVQGRQTCDNTRRLFDIIDLANRSGTPGLLLSLDAEKAFDRMHWGFMRQTLEAFQFPASFIQSVMALYSTPSAKVLSMGFSSPTFPITNGTRQGCPLSPLIFVLALEPLASHIRLNTFISGLPTPAGEQKLALFADDILLYLSTPDTSLPPLFNLLETYGRLSYYKNNVGKTQALPLHIPGPSLGDLKTQYSFDWRSDSIKYLGIFLTKNRSSIVKHNYLPLLQSIEKQLQSWHSVDLSWLGRMASLKMSILPQILYYFRNVPIFLPAHILLRLQKMLFAHIWKRKPPRVSATTITTPRELGGLGFPDLLRYYRASLLAQLLAALHSSEPPVWLRLENAVIAPNSIHDFMWYDPLPRSKLEGILPSSYLSVLTWRHWGRPLLKPLSLLSFAPLSFLSRLSPDLNLASWTLQGVTLVQHLLTPTSIKLFPDLVQEFGISSKEIFTYLRIKHILLAHRTRAIPGKEMTAFHRLCLGKKNLRKPLSLCYRCLVSPNTECKLPYMLRWEKDLNLSFSREDWFYATSSVYRLSKSTGMREAHLKLLYTAGTLPLLDCIISLRVPTYAGVVQQRRVLCYTFFGPARKLALTGLISMA
uniref:Reverse transcriptase domain-containing protein n=1 Tax=Leptobrachium leishanense TaxID=445787 RepID=A0A8C5Q8F8_9ANUR